VSGDILSATGLVKRYRNKVAVGGVDLEVRGSEVVGLLGPNGAGKTTIFNMIAGSVRLSEGKVHLGDQDIPELPMYRRARMGIT